MANDVIIFEEKVTRENIEERRKELPSDIHLVEYLKGNELHVDAVRSYRKVDIFDHLHDRGFAVLEIVSGFGRIRPNCFTK